MAAVTAVRVDLFLPLLPEWAYLPCVLIKLSLPSMPTVIVRFHDQRSATPPSPTKRPADRPFCASISRDMLSRRSLATADIICAAGPSSPEAEQLVSRVRAGLFAGHAPEPIADGEGGTYKLFGADGECVAIFKPADEEPHAAGNPKRHDDSPKRDGILPGECARREVAAYVMDQAIADPAARAGVPCTALVHLRHPRWGAAAKLGSVQKWVHEAESGADVGSSDFSVDDVHRIGLLDLRTLNTDRHEGNLLVTRSAGKAALTPIDHGFALPASLSETYYAWQHWSQAKRPFAPQVLAAIAALNPEHDAERLRQLGLGDVEIRNSRLATLLLQRMAAAGATLHEIAAVVCRQKLELPSRLEQLVADAKGLALQGQGSLEDHFVRLVQKETEATRPAPASS